MSEKSSPDVGSLLVSDVGVGELHLLMHSQVKIQQSGWMIGYLVWKGLQIGMVGLQTKK